jgi:aspartyl-tRNA(Asn)/glutamyl-tRNA(Gln) amidotransferase subunit A
MPAAARLAGAASRAQPPGDVVSLDVATLAERVRARKLSAIDVAEAYLQRTDRLNPRLNALVTVTAARAREDARRLDASLRKGEPAPHLAGVPVAHKDLFETAGIRTTAGSRLFDRHVPSEDATVVTRLAAAGTILVGKANTHELGGGVTTINPFYGTTRNPWDLTRVAGGSSGGSAAAVAAFLAAAATGSDTGGSIRIPAAFCGCVGLKPTFGRVSTAGLLGACPTFDHSGVLARTVADATILYQRLAGYDVRDPSTSPAPATTARLRPSAPAARLRIGVPRAFFFDALQPGVAGAVEAAVDVFRAARAEVRDIDFPIDRETMARVFDPIVVSEIHQRFAPDWQRRPELFSKAFAGFFAAPLPSALELVAAHRALAAYRAAVRRVFETVDVVMTPTVAVTAPAIDGSIDGALILRNTWPFNAAQTPAMSLPCGFDAAGLPVGLQLVAAPYDEATLFEAATVYEGATSWHRRHPQLESRPG